MATMVAMIRILIFFTCFINHIKNIELYIYKHIGMPDALRDVYINVTQPQFVHEPVNGKDWK